MLNVKSVEIQAYNLCNLSIKCPVYEGETFHVGNYLKYF